MEFAFGGYNRYTRTTGTTRLGALTLIMLTLMTFIPTMALTGCTPAQEQQVVTIIENNLPTVITDVTSIIQIVAAFTTTQGTQQPTALQSALSTIQTKGTDVTTILAQFKAGKSTWANVLAAVNALLAASDATLDLSGIKDPTTLAQAKAYIVAIQLGISIIDGAVQTVLPKDQIKARASARQIKLSKLSRDWTPAQKQFVATQLASVTHNASWSELYSYEVRQGF